MSLRHRALTIALVALLGVGCTSGGDDGPAVAGPKADSVVVFKPGATDLNALDLRDKLLALPGVEGIIYDQPDKRLRVDFTSSATDAERQAVIDAAQADTSVAQVGDGTGTGSDAPMQQPAPGVSSQQQAPSPS